MEGSMEDLRDVEYLPEPSKTDASSHRLSRYSVSKTVGARVMGWAPVTVEPVAQSRRRPPSHRCGGVRPVGFGSLFMWQNQWLVVELPLPDSEWAYESTKFAVATRKATLVTVFGYAWLTRGWRFARCAGRSIGRFPRFDRRFDRTH